jgi:hypothetical protein
MPHQVPDPCSPAELIVAPAAGVARDATTGARGADHGSIHGGIAPNIIPNAWICRHLRAFEPTLRERLPKPRELTDELEPADGRRGAGDDRLLPTAQRSAMADLVRLVAAELDVV